MNGDKEFAFSLILGFLILLGLSIWGFCDQQVKYDKNINNISQMVAEYSSSNSTVECRIFKSVASCHNYSCPKSRHDPCGICKKCSYKDEWVKCSTEEFKKIRLEKIGYEFGTWFLSVIGLTICFLMALAFLICLIYSYCEFKREQRYSIV